MQPALIVGKEHEAFIFLDGWTASTLVSCSVYYFFSCSFFSNFMLFFFLSFIHQFQTQNGNRSAQAEHTVLITENGVDVLTR